MAEGAPTTEPEAADGAVLEGGNYEVIRERLLEQGRVLAEKAESLNASRQETFGGTELKVLANGRVRTENNCVPRDIVQLGGHLLFGFNVHMGLKQETAVAIWSQVSLVKGVLIYSL